MPTKQKPKLNTIKENNNTNPKKKGRFTLSSFAPNNQGRMVVVPIPKKKGRFTLLPNAANLKQGKLVVVPKKKRKSNKTSELVVLRMKHAVLKSKLCEIKKMLQNLTTCV
tara:strand:- start:157 stop:486 length:330 start_codon:yes stop_codon:yes gene_type:complete